MKRLLLAAVMIAASCLPLFAQDYSFTTYDWVAKPGVIAIPEKYKTEKEAILDRHVKIELSVAGNVAKQYYLFHEQRFVNSPDAVERNNRIYIPFNMDESVLANKARVILPNGKVIVLKSDDIKEEVDEERGVKLHYFAITGLEQGAVIERLFVLEEGPELKGKTVRLQAEYPIAALDFQFIYPKHLKFKTKSYNGVAEPVEDTASVKEKIVLGIKDTDVAGLSEDEAYSNRSANVRMWRYKLQANYANGANNINSFKEFATNLYERMNPEFSKKDQKAIDDFVAQIPKSSDPEEQIWHVENKVKKSINYNRFLDSREKIADILTSKQANQTELLMLYLALFKKMGIENQVVFTSDRESVPFDRDFESYENLDDFLFYFPAVKHYLAPLSVEYRIPLFPTGLGHNNGLFVKGKTFAGVAMGIGEINFIELPGSDITHDYQDITIDLTKDMDSPHVTAKMTYGGNSAINFQPVKDFVDADNYKKFLKQIAENYTAQAEYETLTTENDGLDNVGRKPFIMNLTFDGKDLMQKAGGNHLLSAGLVIGRQMELYQETTRVLPVEIDYPHYYTRTIRLLLPKGAKVKNLEKFDMDYKCEFDGKTQCAFTSKWKQEGDVVTIENVEYYNAVKYPLASFEAYRKVINAAADFNKVVLVVTE
ncbi:MAG TPA: DUF3857 domain-containing protein [Flavobacterium sp.]|nr:DUF3857 domain-containing protein [Flavobacterium sp.]